MLHPIGIGRVETRKVVLVARISSLSAKRYLNATNFFTTVVLLRYTAATTQEKRAEDDIESEKEVASVPTVSRLSRARSNLGLVAGVTPVGEDGWDSTR